MMHLPPEQNDRFYRIWFALLNYVNAQRQLVTSFPAARGLEPIPTATIKLLRDALWADDRLRDTFVAENPADLSAADLALVASWQERRAGNFFLLRHLKRHTIFLTADSPERAYGVLGLVCSIAEIVGPTVPLYLRAVLLPWEGRIIYDSLLEPYSVGFGSGIRSSMNLAYRDAREREGIVTSLGAVMGDGDPAAARQGVLARNGTILGAFRRDLARRGLLQATVEQHVERLAAFAEGALLAQDSPRGLLELTPVDVQRYLAGAATKADATSIKRFVQFLATTDRVDPERAAALRQQLR